MIRQPSTTFILRLVAIGQGIVSLMRIAASCIINGTSLKIEGGRGCNIFFPVLGGDGTKIAHTGDIFDQPPGQNAMNSGQACRPCMGSCSLIPGRGCFGDLHGDEIVVSPPSPTVEPLLGLRSRVWLHPTLY